MGLPQESTPLWYVVHTYSGYENKVKSNIEKIVENRNLEHLILAVKVPVEKVIEINGKEEKEIERKLFPSYVLIKMVMNDESWHIIRNTSGVTGFVGPGSKPVPLSDHEVEALGVEVKIIEINYEVGDSVRICDGPLSGFIGLVEEISPDKKTIVVSASMFGRETKVELGSMQVKPLD
ncbi:MAG TPA: transcription termination/antitermination factor NusG [Clostridiales bacterium]|nr:transcription termination/antitermination protein NusG [Eubacteriales bacterium]HBR30935.1 transcription termination/antitermination factor NusG [Clostridiales bacterium]